MSNIPCQIAHGTSLSITPRHRGPVLWFDASTAKLRLAQQTPSRLHICLHNLARVSGAMRRNLDAPVIMGIDIHAFR
jgi:hypothetical protein